MKKRGAPVSNLTDDQIREVIHQHAVEFRDNAPTSAAQAANIILEGVKAEMANFGGRRQDAQMFDAFCKRSSCRSL